MLVFPAAVSVRWIVEFRVLGLLQVFANGRPVTIGRGKESALLALLLVNSNQPLSIERVIDELWEEWPAAGERSQDGSDLRFAPAGTPRR